MKAKLVCYTLGKVSSTVRNKFKRKLSGFKDHSNKGQYSYHRKGILDKTPNFRPIRSVILVNTKNINEIIKFLKKYKTKYFVFNVDIPKNLLKI